MALASSVGLVSGLNFDDLIQRLQEVSQRSVQVLEGRSAGFQGKSIAYQAINLRLKESGITFHMSEVKGPVMDRLKGTHFLHELTGKVYLTQFEAVSEIKTEVGKSET